MKRQNHPIFLVFAIISLLIFAVSPEGKTEEQTLAGVRVETITLGIVSEKPKEKIELHSDFVNYLARKLSSTSEIRGSVVVVPTPLQLAKLLNEKKVDFYIESPYPTFVINKGTGGRLLLRRWKGGVSEYRSVLFTRRDSGITRLEDLLGQIIAFEDPGSTSGFFLPKVLLFRKGFKLTEKSSFEANVSPKEIGYVFADGSEKKLLDWVLLRNVAAGGLSNIDLNKLDEKRKAEVLQIAETEMFPRHFLSVRKDLDPDIVNRLKDILLAMHQDPEGQKALKKSDNTTKFDVLPGGEKMMRRKFRQLFG